MKLGKREIESIWEFLRTRVECGPRENFRARVQRWVADGELSLEDKNGALEIRTSAGVTMRLQRPIERGTRRHPLLKARR